ncbi:hypothetical protein AGRA3207_007625 [Actinomadura graeca]|uniref:Uncharacterized protein n=1 Tax=Actinomadura graeca TaxID=2750812 RepID=A0ABX8R5C9_9ACTN|nr:hypothetical protein [Actinomadura graeca]QXJ26038.1 hypothetical protein AGRA3207_007625 [Actinomadura graeca]
MTAHLRDSDRQALRLAQDLREEMRAALPQQAAAPSVSPFVDQAGMPSVLLRMDADTARALMAVLAERRVDRAAAPAAEPRRADGSHVPPPAAQPPPAPQAAVATGPIAAVAPPSGGPAYAEPPYGGPTPGTQVFAEPPAGASAFGGTGPTPLVPSVYPRR